MRALRLKLYQETACYKKPYAFKVMETYPLPPHATVKGMLHAVLRADELIPMKISVQGTYEAMAVDYQTHYFFKNGRTAEFALTADGLGVPRAYDHITTMPLYTHLLYGVELLIHVHADDDLLKQLEYEIQNRTEHLSLGRWEDLVRVDQCKIVELTKCDGEVVLPYNAYVPVGMLTPYEPYVPYKLNWTYQIVNNVRVWNKINVGYVQQGQPLYQSDSVLLDTSTGTDYAFFP